MAIDWPYKSLQEISALNARSFAMGPFGSNIRKENYRSVGVPVIRGLNLNAERFYDAGFVFLTEEKADELRNSSAFPQDIVFVAQGTIGQVGIIPKHSRYPRYVLSQNLMKVTCDTDKVDPLYVFYYFRSHYGQHEIFAYANPTGVPCISQPLTSLKSFRVPVVPLPKQRVIAALLSSLDDKIELNRRMDETLEAMVRALFKSWFVDFEPFRDQGMEESKLGPIPRGWNIDKLSKLCSTQYGYTASATDEPVGPHLLRVMDINKQNWIEWASVPYCQIEERDKPKYALDVGDVVVARMADPGKSAIIEQPNDAVFASYLVRLKTPSLAHAYYVYGFLKSRAYAEYAEGAMGGSSVQKSMNARVIVDTDLVIPSRQTLESFLDYILPLRKRLVANVEQSASLATIRDTLMPKLLSGEIRVKDAEKFVEV